jgi:hypothetical protein
MYSLLSSDAKAGGAKKSVGLLSDVVGSVVDVLAEREGIFGISESLSIDAFAMVS